MELEGRAARRPLPRQMDVGDWNVDVDVRSGVSSSLSVPRDRTIWDARATASDASRRLSIGEERRHDARNVLRPVNRYDSTVLTSRANEEPWSGSSSSWRARETAGRAEAPSYARMAERVMEREPASQRPQPRAIPDTRRLDEPRRSLSMYRTADELGARVPSLSHERESVRRADTATPQAAEEESRWLRPGHSESMTYTPPREQYRQATPPSTVRSEASTALTSSPFTPSLIDTPPSKGRSVMVSPPYTPSSEDTSTPYTSPGPSQSLPSHRNTQEPPPSSTTEDHVVDEEGDSNALRVETSSSDPSTADDDRSTAAFSASSEVTSRASLSPRRQREQLYDFRRDMRQVFARIDEMVDAHRDMFKCDAFSGLPEFNAVVARETASFASETFDQLTKLRERFEAMTNAWTRPASEAPVPEQPRQLRRPDGDESRRTSGSTMDSTSTTTGRSAPCASESRWSAAESSDSPEFPTVSSQRDEEGSNRAVPRPRWQPTLSTLSNDDDSSSSAPSTPTRVACASSVSSELPTLSRPSTATSSAPSTRPNVFEDFDKRMEEIRASLNAMSRDKPRPPPSPRSVSTRLPTAAIKFRHGTDEDDDDDTQDEPRGGENDARLGNRAALPWHSRHTPPAPATTRHDREARLRQLLRELQTTGEHLEAVGDSA